jgi:hypothetical protein
MPRRKPLVVDDDVLRPLPDKPRVRETARIWQEDVVLRDTRKPSTGETMMLLRKMIAERTGEAWHAVARLRPLSEDEDCRFQVYARCVSGQQWVGEYAADLTSDDMILIINDIVEMRATDLPMAAPQVIKDADGDVIENSSLVGQRREIQLANGNIASVVVRRSSSNESVTAEQARVERDLKSSGTVILMAEKNEYVGWNGVGYFIQPGENEVPRAVADIYLQSLKESRQARARMSMVLNEVQSMSWQGAEAMGRGN